MPLYRLREDVVKGLRVGNLMVLVQIGSMPHDLTLKNIDLFAQEPQALDRARGGGDPTFDALDLSEREALREVAHRQ